MNFDRIPDVAFLLEDYNEKDISSVLETYSKIGDVKKQLEMLEESVKDNIRVFLKENQITNYIDKKTETHISILAITREDIDKEKVKLFLTPNQWLSVQKTTTYEKMTIMTKEMRNNIKKYMKKN
jgi:hypothetical protein